MKALSAFDPADLKAFEPTEKAALLATVSPDGLPHLSLITTLQAKSEKQLIWGQFTEGFSKLYVKDNPKTGWLIMTMDKKLWRGKADYTHAATEGDDYTMFNEKPMFRYNTYFGIHTVHYMDLIETTAKQCLPLLSIVVSSLLTKLVKTAAVNGTEKPALSPWARGLFDQLDSVKFISYVDRDGYPVILPLIQCQAVNRGRLAFSPVAYRRELLAIPEGSPVAVFGMTFDMEDVLARGVFRGYRRYRGVRLGAVDIDWVYNSMPPNHRQVYPPVPITPVVDF